MTEVVDPSGVRWTVRRRWPVPRMPRFRGRVDADGATVVDAGDDLTGLALGIAITIAVLVLLPVLLFAAELLILVPVLVAAAVLARVARQRPWTLEARSG